MELNETGHKILFRDKRRRLNLFNIDTQAKTSLLSYCTYVQVRNSKAHKSPLGRLDASIIDSYLDFSVGAQ